MTDPKLIVKKVDGSILFDTRKITYGLVKSGNMAYIQSWSRRFYRGNNLDPAYGTSWSESTIGGQGTGMDDVYGFTVMNAHSPIAFITGGGCLNTINRNPDGSCTFFYTATNASCKFFCFDLMSDFISGRPYLKTYLSDGTLSFNSLQPPLNISTAVQAPAYTTGGVGGTTAPYDGGYVSYVNTLFASVRFYRSVPLAPNIEYAAHLPWTRGGTVQPTVNIGASSGQQHGLIEGCFGVVGGIYFSFCEVGTTPQSIGLTTIANTIFKGIVPSPRPTALVITTAGLPFPFN